MRIVGAVVLLLLALPASAQTARVRADDTVGCKTAETLSIVRGELRRVAPSPGWETRIGKLGCVPVAADLRWRVVGEEPGGIVRMQLAEPGAPSPVLYFSASDVAR